jgi:predicted dehydrogenase
MKHLKVGIAGYGIVGKRRRQFTDQHPQMEVVAVCDQKFNQGGQIIDGVRSYQHYKDLLDEEIDCLFVCLPNYLASDVTIAGLEKEVHVFCEKPPGRDLSDIVRVISCEKRHPQLKLKYGFNHRYHDSVREALAILNSGKLGHLLNMRGVYGKSKIVPFSGNWRAEREKAGGGILLDQGIHMVDLMRLFAGDFEEIHSFISNDFWSKDVEDNAYAIMKTSDGVVAMLHSTATSWRHRFYLELTLSEGSITLSGILSGTKSYGDEKITIAYADEGDSGQPKECTTQYHDDNSWRDEIYQFAEAILGNQEITEGSSLEALKTMKLIYRIYCADPDWKKAYKLEETLDDKEICG